MEIESKRTTLRRAVSKKVTCSPQGANNNNDEKPPFSADIFISMPASVYGYIKQE